MRQFGSRWGIKGASELSDGLSAVYRFETRIGEGAQTTDEIYVGLGGGFGTVSMGKLPAAGNVHAGFVDNSVFLGGNAGLLANKQGSVISYASPSIGGFSFQVDAQGDRSAQDKDVNAAQFGATMQLGESGKIGVAYIDRATKGKDTPTRKANAKVEGGEVKTAAVAADGTAHLDDDRTAMIAGQYRIGGMALHLGYGQRKWDTDSTAGKWDEDEDDYAKGLAGGDLLDKKQKTTFFGVGGGIGDTGVSFFLQVKDTKTDSNKVTTSYEDKRTSFYEGKTTVINAPDNDKKGGWYINDTTNVITGVADGSGVANAKTVAQYRTAGINAAKAAGLAVIETGDNIGKIRLSGQTSDNDADNPNYQGNDDLAKDRARGSAKSSEKNTPFVIGVSRSLGGGASIHLEHDNKDSDTSHNVTALFLKVDF